MQPNLIYILSDQHNAAVWGGAGDPYVHTPNIDRLAAQGVSLEDCSCGSPLCVPSRCALLSSQSPWKTGLLNNMQSLPEHLPTFAHSLTAAGYETVLCGRMHFVGYDQNHGFSRRLVGDITGGMHARLHADSKNKKNNYGMLSGTSGQNLRAVELSGGGDSAVLHFDRDVTDAAVEYLHTRAKTDRPLMLTVGLYGPHCPYVAPPELFKKYYDMLPAYPSVTPEEVKAMHPAMAQWIENRGVQDVTPEDVRRARAAYYALVERTDQLVGEILTAARETLGEDNTVLMYGSDHGDCIGAHGYFWKSSFFDGSVRVPMIFRWKDHFPEGKTLRAPTTLLDLAPTFIELGGGEQLPDSDGRSLVRDLTAGVSQEDDRWIFSFCSDIKGDVPSAMLLNHRCKLILHAGFPPQLYDRVADPMENNDLSGDPAAKEIKDDMTRRLLAVWDPEKALRDQKTAIARQRMIGIAHGEMDLVSPADWHCDPSLNHIDIKK